MNVDQKQLELLWAIIQIQGVPSGQGVWKQVSDLLSDNPPNETVRSRWRSLETKFKKMNWTEEPTETPDAGDATVKKPRATPKKKTGEPATKKPRGKKAMKSVEKVQEDEDVGLKEAGYDQAAGGEEDMMGAGSKRTYEAFNAQQGYYGYDNDHGNAY